MLLHHDIRVGHISIVVKKEESPSFFFNCNSRTDDGFIFVLDGNGIFTDSSGSYSLKRHSIMLLHRKDTYRCEAGDAGLKYITTAFRLHPEKAFNTINLPSFVDAENHPYILKRAEEMLNTWEERSPWYIMETRLILEQILLDIISFTLAPHSELAFGGRISPAISYVNKHYDSDMSNEQLAALCDMSVTHFRRLFKEQLGMSPLKYREEIRLHWAIKLLESQMFNVSEVAERLGYSDIYHFSKVIKSHTGKPPSYYKKG